MNSSIYFQITSLFYISLLIVVYFSKKRLKSLENNIYISIMITDITALVLDIMSIFTIRYMDKIPIINTIITKLYLALLLAWIFLFTIYILVISYKNRENEKHYFNIIRYVSICAYIVYLILLIILPLYYVNEGDIVYSYGPSAILSYGVSGVCVIIEIVCTIMNFKHIKKVKLLPIFLFMFFGIASILIQINNPSILLISAMDTFITFLMYFTIENPDMKLIKELNVAKDQADKANQAKSEFLSSMSHEIRTPLNAIVGFSQALKEENLPKEAKEEVDDIVMASNSLLEIVNGILDISKIESGKIEIVNSEYKFKEMFNELVILSKGRLGDKALDFKYSYDDSIPAVLYGDYTRIKQVILNLLTNAIKYTREGYVDFKVSSVIKDDICRIIVSVEDSGIGIKQENINKLFSKFERLDLDKNATIEGTGLGLAITKKLVELMGGKIVVQSVYGKGSKFTVAIDQKIIAGETEEIETEEQEEKAIDVSGKKVLIVDDNKINLKVASRLLQNYKVIAEEVDSGFSCIDKINSGEKYDIILMDDMMPKMSGVETLKKLKEIEDFNIPVIALTANAIAGMREKYLAEGFTDYLAKPIDKGELNNIISKYLNK